MRITNKIMQRNNLANINTNKVYQDALSTQMSTQKKISRPSEDPVVAIRALRLRSNVTEVSQYYSKNIPDAESWLNITEDALKNHSQILTNMISQVTKGANGDLTSSDRQIIMEQLKALSDEIYTTANADYAGRYVFTGYRTDTSLSLTAAEQRLYTITQQLHSGELQKITKVNTGDLLDITEGNYRTMTGVNENSISSVDVYRIQLPYNNCDDATAVTVSYGPTSLNATMRHVDGNPDPYKEAADDKNAVIFVPETGEVLLGETVYSNLVALKDDPNTKADESEFRVSFGKKDWVAGDLRPEHYFACKDQKDGIEYNQEYLGVDAKRQEIEYDVGFNQKIRVNSTADECFQHAIGRCVDDLAVAMEDVINIERVKNSISNKLKLATGTDAELLQQQLDAADKAYTLAKDKCQKLFESSISKVQGFLDDANVAITNCGTRSSKVELIKNRMQNQKTTIETLKSENEDVDITEAAIQLNSAELTYQAALMATGKVMQNTLLNFI